MAGSMISERELKLLEEIGDRAKPTDAEVRALFEEQYQTVNLRTVTAYEKADADELLRLLQDGADMARLARERSAVRYR